MRSLVKHTALLALFPLGGLLGAAGCENTAGDCKLTADCTGGLGATTAPPVPCDPSKWDGSFPDSCGVFVSATAQDGGNGTPSKPLKTIGDALAAANAKSLVHIYACNETFAEVVTLPSGVELHGGLDCKNGWKPGEAARTTLAPIEAGVALTFEPGNLIRVENVQVIAQDAGAPGAPSIAAEAQDGAVIELARCEIDAGNGADGDDGSPESTPAHDGAPGTPGDPACMNGNGGGGGGLVCGVTSLDGGRGGQGGPLSAMVESGGAGDSGKGPSMAPGGMGQPAMAGSCESGTSGMQGVDGTVGAMASPAAPSFDGEKRAAAGQAGTDGGLGGGGGGGGGGKTCTPSLKAGAGGGGGGAGGCGGTGGKGGGAGGHSIALWAAGAQVSFTDVKLTAKNGGKGGNGADGQAGGKGGPGAIKGTDGKESIACDGGNGGKGGDGGPGGGGEGGSSIALVWQGTPTVDMTTEFVTGMPGAGGDGATLPSSGAPGEVGLACAGAQKGAAGCKDL